MATVMMVAARHVQPGALYTTKPDVRGSQSGPRLMLCRMVSLKSTVSCGTTAMCARRLRCVTLLMSCPSTRTAPALGS